MANIPSTKRLQIDKATRTMVIVASIAAFVTIFTIISGHNLLTVLSYQNRVINAKSDNLNKLKNDITSSNQLLNSYQTFVNTNTNLLGSPSTGTSQNNGDNAKIILDALPSVYDYPALITSLQGLLSNQGVNIGGITGSDQQATITPSSGAATAITTASPGTAVAIPFTFTVDGPYQNIQNLIKVFEKSIRPMQFKTISLSGSQSDVALTVSAQTFYQPAIKFNLTTETLK